MNPLEFKPWPKIPRLCRDCVVTEKIDGTNASVLVTEDGYVVAGSRTRWLSEDNDNYGFCQWVSGHAEQLRKLGPGHHFGEWWGHGIQRGYGLDHRRFSLFNVKKWRGNPDLPLCCSVVPVLYEGPFDTFSAIREVFADLWQGGSKAAPGFDKPEGIVIFHVAGGYLFKKTFENDEKPKTQATDT